MSQQNIEVVKRVIDAGARGDIDAILALHHLDWEGFIPEEYPVAGTWHGHDGVRGFMHEWLDSFDEFTIEADEFFDHGDGVVVVVRYLGRGRLSSIETTDPWFYAYRLREGKVFAWRPYRERAEAFAAIGLDA